MGSVGQKAGGNPLQPIKRLGGRGGLMGEGTWARYRGHIMSGKRRDASRILEGYLREDLPRAVMA